MLWFFLFFIWIWMLIVVFGDIFRSSDLSGWGKALWSISHRPAVSRGVCVSDRTRQQDAGAHDRVGPGTGQAADASVRSAGHLIRWGRWLPKRSLDWRPCTTTREYYQRDRVPAGKVEGVGLNKRNLDQHTENHLVHMTSAETSSDALSLLEGRLLSRFGLLGPDVVHRCVRGPRRHSSKRQEFAPSWPC